MGSIPTPSIIISSPREASNVKLKRGILAMNNAKHLEIFERLDRFHSRYQGFIALLNLPLRRPGDSEGDVNARSTLRQLTLDALLIEMRKDARWFLTYSGEFIRMLDALPTSPIEKEKDIAPES